MQEQVKRSKMHVIIELEAKNGEAFREVDANEMEINLRSASIQIFLAFCIITQPRPYRWSLVTPGKMEFCTFPE